MNSLQMPMVPRNACMSSKSLQGPQFTIFVALVGLGSLPSMVQQCPNTVILGAQSEVFNPENVSLLMLDLN